MAKQGISLFSGGGVADKGLTENGIGLILSNEIVEERAALIKLNYPNSKVFVEDIWKCYPEIVTYTKWKLQGNELFVMLATPPCQGMSQNGAGTLLSNIRKGKRPEFDERNKLIIPALKVAAKLQPEWILFENVPNMRNTIIEDENGNAINIIELIRECLPEAYVGQEYVVEMADYGLPQRRKRLITIFTRNENAKKLYNKGIQLIPPRTHDKYADAGLLPWVNVGVVLEGFEPLDAKDKENAISKKNPLHRVPVLDKKKYEWIRHTPKNSSAFDNQCINPKCMYKNNQVHGAKRDTSGINKANKDTPLFCAKCGELLPRPYVESNGKKRIMSGYTSAYKRMSWELPAPTLTQNFIYPCSDHKIHPQQNRVLSYAEAAKLQSISDYNYKWGTIEYKGKSYKIAPFSLIKDVIGESAPPLFFDLQTKWIQKLSSEGTERKASILSYANAKI
ncbi:C-5 cytosine-specific DNA methylase [uncultured archaeon]|nr:C-5 cytosine-specific DNA methylase [uncultured archaeon]